MTSFTARMLGAAFGIGALFGGIACANEASSISVTGNIALSTDYMFRGLSQTDNSFEVSGGFDATYGIFYLGTWASNLDFSPAPNAPMELDIYGGIRPTFGPISTDFGMIFYNYPYARDDKLGAGEYDYFEGYGKVSASPITNLTVGASMFYSPEFFGHTGSAEYYEGNASYVLTKALSLSGAFGYQHIDDVSGILNLGISDNYTVWNVGGTYTIGTFSLDLRYWDTDVSGKDPIAVYYTSRDNAKGRFVFTVKKAL